MIFVVNGAFGQQNHLTFPVRNTAVLNLRVPSQPGYPPKTMIPGDFYTLQLGFFCKQELKFEAITKIPFKFRLGTVQYCDWMEGKRNVGILPAY